LSVIGYTFTISPPARQRDWHEPRDGI